MKRPICFLPVNEQSWAYLAAATRDEVAAAPPNSTVLLRVVIDPQGRVSPASKITVERFPLRDSDSDLDSV